MAVKGGAKAQGIGPSRGGQTSKIHALTDVLGRPFALHLTAGNVSDMKAAPVLLAGLTGARYVLADKGYDANALRKMLRSVSIVPVIPGRRNRKRAIALAETINGLYKAEVIWRQRSWPSASAVEMATLRWVDWFNNHRLFGPIGHIPPAEAEANYYAARETLDMVA